MIAHFAVKPQTEQNFLAEVVAGGPISAVRYVGVLGGAACKCAWNRGGEPRREVVFVCRAAPGSVSDLRRLTVVTLAPHLGEIAGTLALGRRPAAAWLPCAPPFSF